MKKIKQILLLIMTVVLILPSFLVPALNEHVAAEGSPGEFSSKDEVVYATLSPSGERKEIYVVNILDVVKKGTIVDYGSYSNLKNLTNLSEIEQKEDTVEFTASEGKFYYQGNKNDALLPWNIRISYLLDGKQINPEELAGKDGFVEIQIQTSANESIDSVFFENYLLQISLNLNPKIFNNIETSGAMIANAGKNKQVTFTVMPEQAGELSIEADVVDFELQGIDIVAVPQSMSIDAPDMGDMTGDMKSLSDAIKEISDGIGELNNGVSKLNIGVADLRDGSGQFNKGMAGIDGASSGLVGASVRIGEGLDTMSKALNGNSGETDLSALKELPDGLLQLANGLRQTAAGLVKLNKGYAVAYSSLHDAMMAIPNYEITEKEIQGLYMSGANSDVIDQLVKTYTAARTAKGTYSDVKEAFAAVEPTLNGVSSTVTGMAKTLESTATGISSQLEVMNMADSIGALQAGLSTLSNNYKEFHAGIVSYTDGVGQLSSSYNDVHAGIVELSSGTGELAAGVDKLDDGTNKLYQSTKDMPEQMQAQVDQMIADYDKSDFDAVSFVSAENGKINSVQFVIKTDSIKKQKQESNEEQEEEKRGFWDRLTNLFKGLW